MSESEEFIDPLDAHTKRDPLPGAGIRVIVLALQGRDKAEAVADGLKVLVESRGRMTETRIVEVADGWNRAIETGLEGAALPLVLITFAEDSWTAEHLDPLLKTIDACDHVVGREQLGATAAVFRWLGSLRWRILFNIPVRDTISPIQLHRREKLERIPFQSRSSFLCVELLAKATFFGHLISEQRVPVLRASGLRSWSWQDFKTVFHHPGFARESSPPEDAQCQDEGEHRPDEQDQERRVDVEPPGTLEDHLSQRGDELRERERLNDRLGDRREALG